MSAIKVLALVWLAACGYPAAEECRDFELESIELEQLQLDIVGGSQTTDKVEVVPKEGQEYDMLAEVEKRRKVMPRAAQWPAPFVTTCTDEPVDWTSSSGTPCMTYADMDGCTPSGGYGIGWNASLLGTFDDWANMGKTAVEACCACGGGSRTSTPDTSSLVGTTSSPTLPPTPASPALDPTPATLSPASCPNATTSLESGVLAGSSVLSVLDISCFKKGDRIMVTVPSGSQSDEEEVQEVIFLTVSRLSKNSSATPGVIQVTPPVTFTYPAGSVLTRIHPGLANSMASAAGDPHMQNILGQRFDVVRQGRYALLQIPRGASDSGTLLRVQADAKHEGGACADMYFKALNITGAWAHATGGYTYVADAPQTTGNWMAFGKVKVKVAWGHTQTGVNYLNFFVKDLKRVGLEIGGLLGKDDHSIAATSTAKCAGILSLRDSEEEEGGEETEDVATRYSSYALAEM